MRTLTVVKLSLVALVAVGVADAQAHPTDYWTCKKTYQHVHLSRPSEGHMNKHKCRGVSQPSAPSQAAPTPAGDPRVSELSDQRWGFVQVLGGIAGTRVEPGESVSETLVGVVDRAYAAVAPEHVAPPPFSVLPDVPLGTDRGCVFDGCDLLIGDRNGWRSEALDSRLWGDHLETTARAYIALGTPATLDALNAALTAWRAHRDG